jgi:hypothetical protein
MSKVKLTTVSEVPEGSAQAAPKWFGYYYAEDERYGHHYLHEIAGAANLTQINYYADIDFVELTKTRQANKLKVALMFHLNEAQLNNKDGKRTRIFQKAKQQMSVDSTFINSLVFISPSEEWYTRLEHGNFDNWETFRDLNSDQRRVRMKQLLDAMFAEMKQFFPGIRTLLVENNWDQPGRLIPTHLDVLGIDAYFFKEGDECGEREKRKFDDKVTAVYERARALRKPILAVGGSYELGEEKMPPPCQLRWYYDLARTRPDVLGINWFLWATTNKVTGLRDPRFSEQRNYLLQLGKNAILGADPLMYIDTPVKGRVERSFTVAGWAIDQEASAGSGIERVHVHVFPNPGSGAKPIFLGEAQLGIARSDVATYFGNPQFNRSGYRLQVKDLPVGKYDIVVSAFSKIAQQFSQHETLQVTVTAPPSRPVLTVDAPTGKVDLHANFMVTGWAVDQAAPRGTGVDAVHVYAQRLPASGPPEKLGVAILGISRPDVAAHFRKPQFEPSGFSLDVTGLAPGAYDLTVHARSTVTGTFNTKKTVRIKSVHSG